MALDNQFYGMRGEGVTHFVKGYAFSGTQDAAGPLAYNKIYDAHVSSGGEMDVHADGNVWWSGSLRDPLAMRRDVGITTGTMAYGFLDVLGIKGRGVNGAPVYIIATEDDGVTTNTADAVPRLQLRNNYLAPTTGDTLARIEFFNRDNNEGASGISAEVRAVMEGTSGQTAIALLTGTGTTLTERLRIRSNGRISMPNLPQNTTGAVTGDLFRDSNNFVKWVP